MFSNKGADFVHIILTIVVIINFRDKMSIIVLYMNTCKPNNLTGVEYYTAYLLTMT